MNKIAVGVLGATGFVGQQYVSLLADHPWFEVAFIAASEASVGKTYKEAVAGRWRYSGALPSKAAELLVSPLDALHDARRQCAFVFSALDTAAALTYEEKYASAGLPVLSVAAAFRHIDDVPMVVPEVNPEHFGLILSQQKARGWKTGFLTVKPNCTVQSFITPLFALHHHFGIKKIMVTTMQAISGAGSSLAASDMVDNIVPYIIGEEDKTESEPLKLLSTLSGGKLVPPKGLAIAAQCNRVPVLDGHMACVSVEFERKPSEKDILHHWQHFRSLPQELALPSAPKQPILYCDAPDRPQPRLDRGNEKGMAITVGRLRPCPILHYRFVALSHNTIRGAAGGSILNAEYLSAEHFL